MGPKMITSQQSIHMLLGISICWLPTLSVSEISTEILEFSVTNHPSHFLWNTLIYSLKPNERFFFFKKKANLPSSLHCCLPYMFLVSLYLLAILSPNGYSIKIHVFYGVISLNSLWPSDAIWQQRSGSTLAQVMACCLMAPSHYLTQC